MVLYSTQEYVIKTFKVRGGNPNNNLSQVPHETCLLGGDIWGQSSLMSPHHKGPERKRLTASVG